MNCKISLDVLNYLAELSMLKLEKEKLELLQSRLSEFLNLSNCLNGSEFKNLEPLYSNVVNSQFIPREDQIKSSLDIEKVLQNTRLKKLNQFKFNTSMESALNDSESGELN